MTLHDFFGTGSILLEIPSGGLLTRLLLRKGREGAWIHLGCSSFNPIKRIVAIAI